MTLTPGAGAAGRGQYRAEEGRVGTAGSGALRWRFRLGPAPPPAAPPSPPRGPVTLRARPPRAGLSGAGPLGGGAWWGADWVGVGVGVGIGFGVGVGGRGCGGGGRALGPA